MFLVLFLFTGIFYQRITHIVAFFISVLMLTAYVIAHYITRKKDDSKHDTDAKIRLVIVRMFCLIYYLFLYLKIRLIFTIAFNICFIPLAILVINDYRRDEFSKRYVHCQIGKRSLLIKITFVTLKAFRCLPCSTSST